MTPIMKKGSYTQVLKPIAEAVMKPYLKSWQFWGNIEAEAQPVRKDMDLIGFDIIIRSAKGNYRHSFIRREDDKGLFYWVETDTKKITTTTGE